MAVLATAAAAEPAPPLTAVLEGYRERAPLAGFTIVDERPPQDKERDRGSIWITRCAFGVAQYGDEETAPSKMALLRRDLEDELGAQLAGTTLTVERYKVMFNAKMAAVAFAEGTPVKLGPAVVGAILVPHNCPESDYTALEVTNRNSPLIVEIAVRLDGNEYSTRMVQSLDREFFTLGRGYPGFTPPDNGPVLFAALHKANAALVEKLRPILAARQAHP